MADLVHDFSSSLPRERAGMRPAHRRQGRVGVQPAPLHGHPEPDFCRPAVGSDPEAEGGFAASREPRVE